MTRNWLARAAQQAQDLAGKAKKKGAEIAEDAQEIAGKAAETVTDAAKAAGAKAVDLAEDAQEAASGAVHAARQKINEATADNDEDNAEDADEKGGK